MTSLFYPIHTKNTKVKIGGKSKYAGQTGVIKYNPSSNTQVYFSVLLDIGMTITRHAESLIIIG